MGSWVRYPTEAFSWVATPKMLSCSIPATSTALVLASVTVQMFAVDLIDRLCLISDLLKLLSKIG